MKNTLFYLIVLLLASCGQMDKPKDKKVSVDTINTKDVETQKETTVPNINIKKTDLQEKIFEIGSKTHFTDECSFYFECDCCSGKVAFNSDSTFYYIDYCMSDETVVKGNYRLTNSAVILEYGELVVLKMYNYENEIDTTAVDFFMRDTLVEANNIKYMPVKCNDKIKLIDAEHNQYVIETSTNYTNFINYLTKELFIERFDKLND